MKKRPTRKKLLQALDGLIWESSYRPVSMVKIYHVNSWGEPKFESQELFYNLDDFVGRLMDLSLSHRIVKISSAAFSYNDGMLVVFRVMEDKDCRTNIDAEFLERIMKLEVKPDESGF